MVAGCEHLGSKVITCVLKANRYAGQLYMSEHSRGI